MCIRDRCWTGGTRRGAAARSSRTPKPGRCSTGSEARLRNGEGTRRRDSRDGSRSRVSRRGKRGKSERARGSSARARARRVRPSAGGSFFERRNERFEDTRAPRRRRVLSLVPEKAFHFTHRGCRLAALKCDTHDVRENTCGATVFGSFLSARFFVCDQTDTHTEKVSSARNDSHTSERARFFCDFRAASRVRRAPESYAICVRPRRERQTLCLICIGIWKF